MQSPTNQKRFSLFVLQRHSHQSHTYVGEPQFAVEMPCADTRELLAENVRYYIKSRQEFRSWGNDVDDIEFAVYLHLVRGQQTIVETP